MGLLTQLFNSIKLKEVKMEVFWCVSVGVGFLVASAYFAYILCRKR